MRFAASDESVLTLDSRGEARGVRAPPGVCTAAEQSGGYISLTRRDNYKDKRVGKKYGGTRALSSVCPDRQHSSTANLRCSLPQPNRKAKLRKPLQEFSLLLISGISRLNHLSLACQFAVLEIISFFRLNHLKEISSELSVVHQSSDCMRLKDYY